MVNCEVMNEIGVLRKNLLDLTLKNNLLSYKISKKRTLEITGITPEDLYNVLVLNEKILKFSTNEQASNDVLGTTETAEALEAKLVYLNQQANSIMEDQGYPVLYLAVGFLEWKDKEEKKSPISPILLIPVELHRTGKSKAFSLKWNNEEAFTSITLQEKMKEHNIFIPDFSTEENMSIEAYFKAVDEAIQNRKDKGWQVIPDIRLDLFNFMKFVMYRDLDPEKWSTETIETEHQLVKKVFDGVDKYTNQVCKPEDVDLIVQAHNSFNVVDADSSQISVIEDAKKGLCMVVEGPPGTGKSQTIVNTIAELMAQGKTVLFISEKPAALNVVKERLSGVGLGDFCLELHSYKSKKSTVLGDIASSLNHSETFRINNKSETIESLKSNLNNYAMALREPYGLIYPSFYALYGARERVTLHFGLKDKQMLRYELAKPEMWSAKEWNDSKFVLSKLAELAPRIVPIQNNAWRGCSPELVLQPELPQISKIVDEGITTITDLCKAINVLSDMTATRKASTIVGVIEMSGAVSLLLQMKGVSIDLLENKEWNSTANAIEAKNIALKVSEYKEAMEGVSKVFNPSIFALNYHEFKELSSKLLKSFNGSYKRLKSDITYCYRDKRTTNDNEIIRDLEQVQTCKKLKIEVEKLEATGKKYYLSSWKGTESNVSELLNYCDWIPQFRQYVERNIYTENVFSIINNVDEEKVSSALNSVIYGKQLLRSQMDKVVDKVKPDFHMIFGKGFDEIDFIKLHGHMKQWSAEIENLTFWSQYVKYRKDCINTKAGYLVLDFEFGKVDASDLVITFEGNYIETLIAMNFRLNPVLYEFIRNVHEGKIDRFKELDNELLKENSKKVSNIIREEMRKTVSDVANLEALKTLQKEFNKKRRHMSIRTLICKSGHVIQKIKPCFMMSPLSVAQYIDPKSITFDVIVFDEASQIKPEDAMGTLLRGNQVIVMGDSKQLPPTDFFDHVINADEYPTDEYSTGDMESILNVCRSSFPVKTLLWHYRSKHESLIAISNQEFYDNSLRIYPSPLQNDDELGLKFIHLPEAIYDKGKTRTNREEAKRIATEVFMHYANYPEKSLGVGAFSASQQEVIEDEIKKLSVKFPKIKIPRLENGERNYFFVKNLETIQGDERDVIFLSIGYGFDANHEMSLNFGALNQLGGERRLNVLITRAKEKCVVFSNFRGQDLDLKNTSSVGLKALKTFLDFAENGKIEMVHDEVQIDETFENSVKGYIESLGYDVHKDIGCSGYKVNLAIQNPVNAGTYIIGIECDGKNYHSSKVCRDRDKLKEKALVGLGWNIVRVWSTGWYLDPHESRKALKEFIENVVKPLDVNPECENLATSL